MTGATNPEGPVLLSTSGSLADRPPPDFPVCQNTDGSVLSRYADLTWDRTPYNAVARTFNLHFKFWPRTEEINDQRSALVGEMQWCMFALIHLRTGSALSNNTLYNYLCGLRDLARFCERRHLGLIQVLSSGEMSLDFMKTTRDRSAPVHFAKLQYQLRSIGSATVGFEILSKVDVLEMRKLVGAYRAGLKQHPPIPTRVYSSILSSIHFLFCEKERAIDDLLRLVEECLSNPLLGIGTTRMKEIRKESGLARSATVVAFPTLLEKHGLLEYWGNNGYQPDRRGMLQALADVQFNVALHVLAYTGMRINEVQSLPLDCLEVTVQDGVSHYIVKGRVTKLTKGKAKCARWITNESTYTAMKLSQRISSLLYSSKNTRFKKQAKKQVDPLLFVSPTYLCGSASGGRSRPSVFHFGRSPEQFARLIPRISEQDIVELIQIDPHRCWKNEPEFREGSPWPLSAHQFRRSLALYAQRSGLVSLPSLKRQLQHITLEMSQYYARGSVFARDFIGSGNSEKHFGEEWQETQPISQYLSYAINVLLANESELYGGHAHWIKTRLKRQNSTVLEDRAQTLKRFQKGELAFIQTPVGGCANPQPCDKNPIDVLHVGCVAENCRHLIGNLKKTERVIAVKERELRALRRTTAGLPEILHEEAEYKKLVDGYEKAKSFSAGGAKS